MLPEYYSLEFARFEGSTASYLALDCPETQPPIAFRGNVSLVIFS
jgi:hypothetical protein